MRELIPKLQQLLPQLKIRLRASARRRLALDVMALITGVRAAVMLDYISCTPQMLQQVCQLLLHLSQVWNEVGALRVLHMEDCGYLIHPSYLLEHMDQSLRSSPQLLFVILDDDTPRKASRVEHEAIVQGLVQIQQKISSLFLAQNENSCPLHDSQELKEENLLKGPVGKSPSVLAVGNITNGSDILLPTFNGWLLGYPVVYHFKEENASRAGRCVTSSPVQLHQILISSTFLNSSSQKDGELKYDEDELLSYTIPSSLSPLNLSEDWAQLLLQRVAVSVQRASNVWTSVRMEVTTRKMESMVL